jgi:hypothetical protein
MEAVGEALGCGVATVGRATQKFQDEKVIGLQLEPKVYNVWNFASVDPRYGMDYPGRIPGQIIEQLLLRV